MTLFVHLANILFLASYLVKDILWLRIITVVAMLTLIPYYFLSGLYIPIAWNVVFLFINIYQIYQVWLERRPVFLSQEEEMIRGQLFPGLNARNFQRLLNLGQWETYDPAKTLIKEQEERGKLIVLVDGCAQVRKQNKTIASIYPFQFIGEMSFMTHSPTVADVITLETSRMIVWQAKDLDLLFEKFPIIKENLQLNISNDLVKKIKTIAHI